MLKAATTSIADPSRASESESESVRCGLGTSLAASLAVCRPGGPLKGTVTARRARGGVIIMMHAHRRIHAKC